MIGKITVTGSGYDPDNPKPDPTLEKCSVCSSPATPDNGTGLKECRLRVPGKATLFQTGTVWLCAECRKDKNLRGRFKVVS